MHKDVVGLEVSVHVVHHVQVLEGYEDLAGVELDFALFEVRVGHAFEQLVQLGAGAVSEERGVSGE